VGERKKCLKDIALQYFSSIVSRLARAASFRLTRGGGKGGTVLGGGVALPTVRVRLGREPAEGGEHSASNQTRTHNKASSRGEGATKGEPLRGAYC